jgi:hypothetical protein
MSSLRDETWWLFKQNKAYLKHDDDEQETCDGAMSLRSCKHDENMMMNSEQMA